MLVLKTLALQTLSTLIAISGVVIFDVSHKIPSVILGSGVMLFCWIMLMWSWSEIIQKKSIALGVSIIVIKYAILGLILFLVVTNNKCDIAGFLVGISTTVVTAIGYAASEKSPGVFKRKLGY
ncbi:MAG: hypothetical protein IPJ71_16685 [Bdellovibrionales bacterium]|nr:hypothetical protein [Bdellovibrionales bacterium]